MSDSRTGRRFPLELPISIDDKKAKKLRGTTSNVSAAFGMTSSRVAGFCSTAREQRSTPPA